MGHGAWRKRKEIISRYALAAMRYAVQLLITIPDSKGKAVQYFSPGQALAGLVFMKLTSVAQMFRFRQNREFFNPESEWWTKHRQEKRPREMFRKGGDRALNG